MFFFLGGGAGHRLKGGGIPPLPPNTPALTLLQRHSHIPTPAPTAFPTASNPQPLSHPLLTALQPLWDCPDRPPPPLQGLGGLGGCAGCCEGRLRGFLLPTHLRRPPVVNNLPRCVPVCPPPPPPKWCCDFRVAETIFALNRLVPKAPEKILLPIGKAPQRGRGLLDSPVPTHQPTHQSSTQDRSTGGARPHDAAELLPPRPPSGAAAFAESGRRWEGSRQRLARTNGGWRATDGSGRVVGSRGREPAAGGG